MLIQIPDASEDPLKKEKLTEKLLQIMKDNLNPKEYDVLRLSFGINCDKLSAKEIAAKLNMQGTSSYVRVSQLKKQAINRLKQVLNHPQVADYL